MVTHQLQVVQARESSRSESDVLPLSYTVNLIGSHIRSIKSCHCRWPQATFKGLFKYWTPLRSQYFVKYSISPTQLIIKRRTVVLCTLIFYLFFSLLQLGCALWDVSLRLLSITDSRSIEDFNESFVAAWKTTHNYKQVRCESNEALNSIPVGYVYSDFLVCHCLWLVGIIIYVYIYL